MLLLPQVHQSPAPGDREGTGALSSEEAGPLDPDFLYARLRLFSSSASCGLEQDRLHPMPRRRENSGPARSRQLSDGLLREVPQRTEGSIGLLVGLS